ncbi:hypothetical protein HGRIS_002594 [Hohenbuehelia grisea]|uniref:Calcineurin-like phosphoesterase domain-containing protein n=1 Tax=Hohenbuehelia grisea TaxID=104357 RepID=A0ABR3JL28_9AGAR
MRLLWTGVILWFELGTFFYSIRRCPWPSVATIHTHSHQELPRLHVLIAADPQILDHRSYPDRPAYLTYLSQIFTDLNLRKSWRAALRTRPHAVVFLGDMMDNGRAVQTQSEYERYYKRFQSIFASGSKVPQYFVPGNHDTGYVQCQYGETEDPSVTPPIQPWFLVTLFTTSTASLYVSLWSA